MGKNPPEKPDSSTSNTTGNVVTVNLNRAEILHAIKQGAALIEEGKSKADASRAIYELIKDEPKEVIVAAFVSGATLTEKGALTYWYNCRRRASKQK